MRLQRCLPLLKGRHKMRSPTVSEPQGETTTIGIAIVQRCRYSIMLTRTWLQKMRQREEALAISTKGEATGGAARTEAWSDAVSMLLLRIIFSSSHLRRHTLQRLQPQLKKGLMPERTSTRQAE